MVIGDVNHFKKFTTHFLWITKSKTVEIKGNIELQHFMLLNGANWNQRGIEIHEKGIQPTPSFLLMSHTKQELFMWDSE